MRESHTVCFVPPLLRLTIRSLNLLVGSSTLTTGLQLLAQALVETLCLAILHGILHNTAETWLWREPELHLFLPEAFEGG